MKQSMRETVLIKTLGYGDKPKAIKRVVFNQITVLGFTIGHFKKGTIRTCIKGQVWIEISPTSPLIFSYLWEMNG